MLKPALGQLNALLLAMSMLHDRGLGEEMFERDRGALLKLASDYAGACHHLIDAWDEYDSQVQATLSTTRDNDHHGRDVQSTGPER